MAMTRQQHLFLKLSEECHEVGQMASKIMQFGLDEVYDGDGNTLTNRERLFAELNDLLGTLDMLNSQELFGFEPDFAAKIRKQQKITDYREYSVQLGLVEG